jgi:hypothetical protein
VDWSTTCFCCESVLQKRWQFGEIPQSEFRREFGIHRNPCCSISPCHQDLGSKLRGYWLKGGSVKTVSTPDNIAVVREAIERSPDRSARRHSVSLGSSEASVRRILQKDPHFFPYKIQVTHALHERDYVHSEVKIKYGRCSEYHPRSSIISMTFTHCPDRRIDTSLTELPWVLIKAWRIKRSKKVWWLIEPPQYKSGGR